ncbi:hypothetical protein SRHO_G00011020 [Serrasalmus rhombeus]
MAPQLAAAVPVLTCWLGVLFLACTSYDNPLLQQVMIFLTCVRCVLQLRKSDSPNLCQHQIQCFLSVLSIIFCIWYDVPHLNQVCCSSPAGQAYCFSTGPNVMFFTYTKEKVFTYVWCMFLTWTSLLQACRGALGRRWSCRGALCGQRGLHDVSSGQRGEKVSDERPQSRDGNGEKGHSEPP